MNVITKAKIDGLSKVKLRALIKYCHTRLKQIEANKIKLGSIFDMKLREKDDEDGRSKGIKAVLRTAEKRLLQLDKPKKKANKKTSV